MIAAIIFDLDGTLVNTEALKAEAYVRVARALSPDSVDEARIIEAYKDVIGLPLEVVAGTLVDRLGLAEAALSGARELNVHSAAEALATLWRRTYGAMLTDPANLDGHAIPQAIALLRYARRSGMRTGLATMSEGSQAARVLSILNLTGLFDCIASRNDVKKGKPDPAVYVHVARILKTPPDRCLVLEDSSIGIQAALRAGMVCIALTSTFTRINVHASGLLEDEWIVDDPSHLESVARRLIEKGEP